MKALKKLVALLTVLATVGFSLPQANAAEYSSDCGGCGYAECRQCPSLAPAVALGTIALVAIVAVAIQNQSHGHGHSH
jgi:hypothetical protein